MLTQYIRDENKVPFGVIVAFRASTGEIRYGVSLKNPKDKWNKELGRKIAIGRANDGVMFPDVPRKKEYIVNHNLVTMMERANRYFKTSNRFFYNKKPLDAS